MRTRTCFPAVLLGWILLVLLLVAGCSGRSGSGGETQLPAPQKQVEGMTTKDAETADEADEAGDEDVTDDPEDGGEVDGANSSGDADDDDDAADETGGQDVTDYPFDVARPSVKDAEAAVLAIAREQYPGIPTESADVVGMGLDSSGVWWVQAWTSAGPEYESEQWFVTYDGTAWEYFDSGTGMERADYPADILWEDVE